MKLDNVIFRTLRRTTLFILLFSMLLTLSVLYLYFARTEKQQLESQLLLLSRGAEESGRSFLEAADDTYRITWVSSTGIVLYDSEADEEVMENHLGREEIQEAMLYGRGDSERWSDTIGEKTVYEAMRLQDGSVLRISFTRSSLISLTLGLLPYLIVSCLLSLLLSLVISRSLSRRILKPLNTLDLDSPLEGESYEELAPLLTRLDHQQRQIRRQLDEIERRSQEFFAITDNMSEGLILLSSVGNIVSINRSARRILQAPESCIGKSILTVERSPQVQSLLLEGGKDVILKRGDRTYRISATEVLDAQGEKQGLCLLIVDETEKESAESLRREFSANVSHELKTPLHSILASSELLEHGLVKSEDVPIFISRIRKEAERLMTLIEDIIRLSQLDETISFPEEEVSIKELTAQVFETLSGEAASKQVTLHSDVEDVKIKGVKRLLYEIIFNLTDNAIRYNKRGGEVLVSFSGNTLKVSDTGIGIATEHFPRLFERFYRVDKSHSRESGGTGLGLSIVKHAVLYHKGEVEVESEVGKGTTMTVRFP